VGFGGGMVGRCWVQLVFFWALGGTEDGGTIGLY
jgi:hypothetical protein